MIRNGEEGGRERKEKSNKLVVAVANDYNDASKRSKGTVEGVKSRSNYIIYMCSLEGRRDR